MSERKVLNKYYPPDFDPTKIPRARQGKNRQFTVRLMAPCNMRCNTCGEYIYKGKKFNARKEDVENEDYLGLRIYRFYIKCTRCIAEICFKTDPVSTDYIIEAGATRNFMALKLAEEQAEREAKAEAEDDATNPMKVLEKRTEASRNEMAVLEALEELKELNQRHFTPDYENMLTQFAPVPDPVELELKKQEEEDEEFVQSVFGKRDAPTIKRIADDSSSDEEKPVVKKSLIAGFRKPTDIMTEETGASSASSVQSKVDKSISIGSMGFSKKSLVAVKPKSVPEPKTDVRGQGSSSSKGQTPSKNSGLSLLGSYGSDSDSD